MRIQAFRYLLGNMIYSSSQFVIISLLTKFDSTSAVGKYALGLAVTAPVFMLSHLHLRSVFSVDTAEQYRFGEYLGLRLVTTLLAFSVTSGMIAFGGFDESTGLVIFLVSLFRIIEAISDMFFGASQKHERLDQIFISRTAKGLFSILSMVLVYIPTRSLVLFLIVQIAGWLCIMMLYDRTAAAKSMSIKPAFPWGRLFRLSCKSLPLGIVLALMSLNANIPQYAIARYLGEHELGVFASISYLMVACNVVVTALGEAFTPRLARWYAAKQYGAFGRLLVKLILAGAGASAVGSLIAGLFGTRVLTILYSSELASYAPLLFWLTVSTFFIVSSSFLWYAITATQQFRIQIPLFFITAAANAGACLFFIPKYNLLGAAAGTAVSLIVQTAGSLLVLIHITRVKKQRERAGRTPEVKAVHSASV